MTDRNSLALSNLKIEDLNVITEVSGRLGKGWNFSIQPYLDGVQINWKKPNNSFMWRSIGWDRSVVELYSSDSSGDHITLHDIMDL